MNCFQHVTAVAVASCKACGRGLCPHCAAPAGRALACRDRCEDRVAQIEAILDNNARVMAVANRQNALFGILGLVYGLLTVGLGIALRLKWNVPGAVAAVLAVMGAAFAVSGVVRLGRRHRFPEIHEKSTTS